MSNLYKEYPLPWHTYSGGCDKLWQIDAANGNRVTSSLEEDLAQYIVAAANACAGLNPEAIPGFIDAMRHLFDLPIVGEAVRIEQMKAALAKLEESNE